MRFIIAFSFILLYFLLLFLSKNQHFSKSLHMIEVKEEFVSCIHDASQFHMYNHLNVKCLLLENDDGYCLEGGGGRGGGGERLAFYIRWARLCSKAAEVHVSSEESLDRT